MPFCTPLYRPECKFPHKIRSEGQSFALNFVRKFIFNEDIAFNRRPLCANFIVDCLHLLPLMLGKLQLLDTYNDYSNIDLKNRQLLEETFLKDKFAEKILFYKPLLINNDFPFLVAKPFAIVDEQEMGLCIVNLVNESNEIRSRESCVHVTAVVETFEIESARSYKFDSRPQKGALSLFSCIGSLRSHDILFTFRKEIIEGYVIFLTDFFKRIYELEITEKTCNELLELLDEKIPKQKCLVYLQTAEDVQRKLDTQQTRLKKDLAKLL